MCPCMRNKYDPLHSCGMTVRPWRGAPSASRCRLLLPPEPQLAQEPQPAATGQEFWSRGMGCTLAAHGALKETRCPSSTPGPGPGDSWAQEAGLCLVQVLVSGLQVIPQE